MDGHIKTRRHTQNSTGILWNIGLVKDNFYHENSVFWTFFAFVKNVAVVRHNMAGHSRHLVPKHAQVSNRCHNRVFHLDYGPKRHFKVVKARQEI